MPKLTPAQREEAIAMYLEGASTVAVAAQFNVTQGAIWYLLRRRGVPTRGFSEAGRRIPINEHAFDDAPSDPRAAYHLGFLMADGAVDRRANGRLKGISVGVSERDLDYLYSLREFLGSTHAIYRVASHEERPEWQPSAPVYRLTVSSVALAESVGRYGVLPDKTHTARVVGLEDSPDFFRGAVDGDGFVHPGKRGRPVLGLTGAFPLVEQFSQFLRRRLPGCRSTPRPHASIWCARVDGRFGLAAVDLLYSGACVSLARKQAAAEALLARWLPPGSPPLVIRLTREGAERLREEHGTFRAAARALGVPEATFHSRLRKGGSFVRTALPGGHTRRRRRAA